MINGLIQYESISNHMRVYKATGPKKHKMSVKKRVVIIFAQIRF